MKSLKSIEIKDSIIIGGTQEDSDELKSDMEEANQALELFSQFKKVFREDVKDTESLSTTKVVPDALIMEELKTIKEGINKIGNKLDDAIVYVKPGLREEFILHIGAISSVGGGIEYTLTIPLQGVSYSEMKEDLREISGKRIDQLSMLPKKIAKIVEDYLIENKMEDLLNKLREGSVSKVL